MSARIYTRCPACGDTLTVNDNKHLLCTWLKCPNPTLIDQAWDNSTGDVIAAWKDGTITLDDGITTYHPIRALEFVANGGTLQKS